MSTPLDEYALDFLEPDVRRVIKDMLKAVVEHPKIYRNGFKIERQRNGGIRYFLGTTGADGPFFNNQLLPVDVGGSLVHHGIAGPMINSQWTPGTRSFTEAALEWHRRYGGPGPDEIRKRIGRYLRKDPADFQKIDAEAIAQEISVSPKAVQDQVAVLIGLRVVEAHPIGDDEVLVRLSHPDGILWAERGFPPVASLNSPIINVEVNLRLEIRNIIQEARSADIPPELLEKFEARVRRVEEELEKPDGNYQPVKDLVETANNSKELLGPVVKFIYRHWDKIQGLADISDQLF